MRRTPFLLSCVPSALPAPALQLPAAPAPACQSLQCQQGPSDTQLNCSPTSCQHTQIKTSNLNYKALRPEAEGITLMKSHAKEDGCVSRQGVGELALTIRDIVWLLRLILFLLQCIKSVPYLQSNEECISARCSCG